MRPGTVVVAMTNMDPEVLSVKIGDVGVVFEEAGIHGDGAGPCVRWLRPLKDGSFLVIGLCNINPKNVEVLAPF